MIDLFTDGASWIWQYGIPFIVVLSVLVFVHEWGHYAVARHFKVKIDAFSIGFGPELFGWTDKTGCRWKFCAIPLGGFVKMFGDAGAASTPDADKIDHMSAAEKQNTFYGKPVGQRALIVAAGPAINYIFAILLLAALFVIDGRPVTPPTVGAVMIGGAAERAGIQPGDTIKSINGEEMERFQDIARFVMIRLDQPMTIVADRGGEAVTFENVRADKEELRDRFGFTQTRAMLGITATGVVVEPERTAAINGKPVTKDTIAHELDANRGKTVDITFVREDGATARFNGFRLPVPNEPVTQTPEGNIIVQKPVEDIIHYDPLTAVGKAFEETWNITVSTLKALWQMIAGVRSAEELGGLIRIGAVASEAAASGVMAYVMFAALLSINLGLINLFPVPMLDGGHLVFYAVEAASGKPIPERVQEGLFKIGFFALLVLMVFANGNDLVQLLR